MEPPFQRQSLFSSNQPLNHSDFSCCQPLRLLFLSATQTFQPLRFFFLSATQPLNHSGFCSCQPLSHSGFLRGSHSAQDLEWLSGRREPRPGLHILSGSKVECMSRFFYFVHLAGVQLCSCLFERLSLFPQYVRLKRNATFLEGSGAVLDARVPFCTWAGMCLIKLLLVG